MEILMANVQMGSLCFGKNGAFLPISPWNPSSSIRRNLLVSRISLDSKVEKGFWNLNSRMPNWRTRSNLVDREVDTRPCRSGIIDKELTFNPTFGEYLKVMESVRTDRSKNVNADDAGVTNKKREGKYVGKKGEGLEGIKLNERKVGRESATDGRKQGSVGRKGVGWEMVEGILEKRGRVVRSRGGSDFRESRSSLTEKRNHGPNVNRNFARDNVNKGCKESEDIEDGILAKGRRGIRVFRGSGGSGFRENYNSLAEKSNPAVYVKRNRSHGSVNDGSKESQDSSGQGRKVGEFGGRTQRSQVEQNGSEGLGNYMIDWCKNKSLYMKKVERNIGVRETKRSLVGGENSVRGSTGRKSEEPAKAESTSQSEVYYGTGKITEHSDTEFPKSIWSNGTHSKLDQRKRGSNLKSIESNIINKGIDRVEDMFVEKMEGNRNDRERHSSRSNFYASGERLHEQAKRSNHERFNCDAIRMQRHDSRVAETRAELANGDAEFGVRDIDGMDFEDRAAFRDFEVFTDIRHRPRVLRMEMEERIQKLAKWLNATDINMPEWKFSKMMHGARIKFTDHSILRVVQILGQLGNWKRVLQVVEWLQSRERFKSFRSRYIYTTVLEVLGKAKRPLEALNIFHAMHQQSSSYPDLPAYHCIAVILGQAGLMKELFDVIDCMRSPPKKFKMGPVQKWDPCLEPDLVVYNSVLNACVPQKQWEGAFWVLQELKQRNIKPSNTTYGLAMEVMLACGKYNLVHEFFRKVERSSIPGALNYKVLVNTLWREGKIEEAVQAVHNMEGRGIVGSASLYYDLARCLCSAGRCKDALLQVDKICKVAKKPLVVTYTGLIQTCLDSKSIKDASYIYDQMHKFCSPNVVTCNIMLKAYIEHGMFKEAKDHFRKILDGSHRISNKATMSQIVVPDKFTFNTMMEACARMADWDGFEDAYQQMLDHGFYFDVKRHLRLIMDASRAGKGQVLETTWEHLVRFGRVPPPPIIKERFCAKLQEGNCFAAISCINIHQEIEMNAFSERLWLNLLESNAHRFNMDTITNLEQEVSNLIDEHDQLHPLYQNLLNACRKFLGCDRTPLNLPGDSRMLTYTT